MSSQHDRPLYFAYMNHIRDDRELRWCTKSVLLLLASYMGAKTLRAWPSQRTMADAAGVDERTIRRRIKELLEKGWIRLDESYQGKSNCYVGICPSQEEEAAEWE